MFDFASPPLPLPGVEEDRLLPSDFERLAEFIKSYAGIRLPANKLVMLEGRLRRRLRATGVASFADYCDLLFSGQATEDECEQLVNAVTTNKTDFFREPRHFDFVRTTALPALAAAGVRQVRAWSAACSFGAEPYTLAMVLEDHAAASGLGYGILATDIDTDVLARARRGIFPAEMAEPVPAMQRARYMRLSRDRQAVRMVPALRAAIGFAQLNLMTDAYAVGEPMHLIFCRNVLIYFDRDTQERVVRRLAHCLAPEGYLFLGHSETVAGMDLPLVSVGSTIFQRR